MLKTDPILSTRYQVADNWSEITLSTAIEISLIDLPKSFKDLYALEDKSKLILTDDDMSKVIPDIQGKVLALLSDIPSWVCDMLDCDSLMMFYNKYCAAFHFGIINLIYQVPTIKTFKINGSQYQIPKEVTVNGVAIPLKSINAGQFCDVVKYMSQGVEGLPLTMATLCGKDEKDAIGKIEEMKLATMDIAFNFVEAVSDMISHVSANYKWIFDKSSASSKIKSAYNRSGLVNFGTDAWLYEVAESGIGGTYKEVCSMPMYDFVSILSYLRCKNKLYEYSQGKH